MNKRDDETSKEEFDDETPKEELDEKLAKLFVEYEEKSEKLNVESASKMHCPKGVRERWELHDGGVLKKQIKRRCGSGNDEYVAPIPLENIYAFVHDLVRKMGKKDVTKKDILNAVKDAGAHLSNGAIDKLVEILDAVGI